MIMSEFLDWLRMEACRYPTKFPRDAVEFVDELISVTDDDVVTRFDDLADVLNMACPPDMDFSATPEKAAEYLIDRHETLADLEEECDKVAEKIGELLLSFEELFPPKPKPEPVQEYDL